MHYSSALVLSTLAIGQAAAGSIRHASFHARRGTEEKRAPEDAKVNWGGVARDVVDYSNKDLYKNVQWSTFNWNSILATPAPSAPAPSAPAASSAAPEVQAAAAKPSSAAASAPAPAATSASANNANLGNTKVAANQLLTGVSTLISKMGIIGQGTNAVSDNGWAWLAQDGDKNPWKTTFTNGASQNVMLLCWKKVPGTSADSYKDMCLNAVAPLISVMIQPKQSVTVSHKQGASGACGGAYPDTSLAQFGGLSNSWYEYTFTQGQSRFDISMEVNGNGNSIQAVGSKCTSSKSQCVFKCTDGTTSCKDNYKIFNNDNQKNCDASGQNGGCMTGADSESVTVTFQ